MNDKFKALQVINSLGPYMRAFTAAAKRIKMVDFTCIKHY